MRRAAPYAVALVTGAALSLAFPAPDLAPLAWVALVPLLLSIGPSSSLKKGFALGFVFGLGFFGTLLIWIANVGYAAWLILAILQALFAGLFGLAWAAAARIDNAVVRVLAPAVAWVALVEFARSKFPFGGFTWGELAQSQHDLRWMLRPAALAGGWLVAFVCVTCGALLAEAWNSARARDARSAVPWVLGAAALIAAPAFLPANHASGEAIRVAIVQGNVPEPWTGSTDAKEAHILASHLHLTQSLAGTHPGLVVWPESSVALDPNLDERARRGLVLAAQSAGAPMVVGGNEDVDSDHYRVVAWLVSETGKIVATYVKTHLVPFGEYVPGRSLLGWLPLLDQVPRDAIPEDDPTTFAVDGGEVAPVLSYEGDFGSIVRRPIAEGGRLLIVATNTSTWARSWASIQHVAMSQVRAAENGVWVVHAALSGVSGFVAPDGTLVASTPLWKATTLSHEVRFATGVTFYARTGDWFPIACAALLLVLFVAGVRTQPSKSEAV